MSEPPRILRLAPQIPPGPRRLAAFLVALLATLAPAARAADAPPASGPPLVAGEALAASNDLSDLSLEQLGNVRVTSVSRRAESLSQTAASVYACA